MAASALPLFSCASLAATPVTQWNSFDRFSIAQNPNHLWQYLENGTLLPQAVQCAGITGWYCWISGEPIPDAVEIGANRSGAEVQYLTIVVPPHYMSIDPESVPNVTVQWTIPTAGKYRIRGNFLGIDTGETPHGVAVLHNGTTMYSNTISSYTQKETFNFTVQAERHDTIGFVVQTTSNYHNLSTGLQANIKLLPAAN